MPTKSKKGQGRLIIALDIMGFVFIMLGGVLIRFSKDEIISIIGGFVLAGGVTLLGITRYVKK